MLFCFHAPTISKNENAIFRLGPLPNWKDLRFIRGSLGIIGANISGSSYKPGKSIGLAAIIGKNWKAKKLSYCDTSLHFSRLKIIMESPPK